MRGAVGSSGRHNGVLSDLFELVAATGIRRGEVCGLPWTEVTLGEAPRIEIGATRLTIGREVIDDTVKSDAGHRLLALDEDSAALLARPRRRLPRARTEAGSAWIETGLVFVQADGSPWHPDYVTRRSGQLAHPAGLPPVTIHALRHGAAIFALAAGVDPKMVQERLGHSTSALTLDTYTSVLFDLNAGAATATVSMIPRTGRRPGGHTTDAQRSTSRGVRAVGGGVIPGERAKDGSRRGESNP